MIVKELIEFLQKADPSMEVYVGVASDPSYVDGSICLRDSDVTSVIIFREKNCVRIDHEHP